MLFYIFNCCCYSCCQYWFVKLELMLLYWRTSFMFYCRFIWLLRVPFVEVTGFRF